MAKAIRLIRVAKVVVIAVVMSALAACSSVKQPSMLSETTTITPVTKQEVVVQSQPIAEVKLETLEQPDFISEIQKKDENDSLVAYVATKYKIPYNISKQIVFSATINAFSDFPSRDDILAIIAVESSFHPEVSYRGSHGLMQVESKSHRGRLRGRNVHNIDVNIEIGSLALRDCYTLTSNSIKNATLCYNSGFYNFLKGRYRLEYYRKYKAKLLSIQNHDFGISKIP